MKKNERLQALHILVKLLKQKISLSHSMQSNPLVSPLTKEICFGVCRHYFRLACLADHLLSKRPKPIELWVTLLMGLYQLHFMNKPDYAVVKETVALLELLKKSWAKSLVNAVLRTFCRDQAQILASVQNQEAFLYGHPSWFIQRIKKDWPNNWQAILAANDQHPPMSLRVNQQQIQRSQYLQQLEEAKINAHPHLFSAEGLSLQHPCDVHELPGFSQGYVSVQDESAQLAVSLLALAPGLSVLDACCAPGGKTCHILETEPNLAVCLALDVDAKRLERVKANLSRLQLEATLCQGDALHPEQWWDGRLFDRILLDAPCSATGVIRRHPDIKLLRTEAEVTQSAQQQHALLKTLWPLLEPGGLLVYATCSIFREENEQQIMQFIATHPDCQLVTDVYSWGHATDYGWQRFPGQENGDGFFYAVLKRAPSNCFVTEQNLRKNDA